MADRPQPGDRPNVDRVCPLCGGREFVVQFAYDRLMPLEVPFEFVRTDNYWREIHRCIGCGHFLEWHELDQSKLYAHNYVTSTYGDAAGLRRAYERVMSLPPEQSDNAGRVTRVLEFACRHFPDERFMDRRPTLLDVGSGLCVFAARMKESGWEATVLDLDERLIEHARQVAGVPGKVGDITTIGGLELFDVVTFNKVLEHVPDPVAMLHSSSRLLAAGGFVYVEVPDGEAAVSSGKEREEFLLGHIHVFSRKSLELLIERAGFQAVEIERLREPSGKFTLRGFLAIER